MSEERKIETAKSTAPLRWVLKTLAPLFERAQRWTLLPSSFYHDLRNYSVPEKIRTIILSSTVPIFVILAVVFIVMILTTIRDRRENMEAHALAVTNSWDYAQGHLKVYSEMVAAQNVVVKELISSEPHALRMQKAVEPLLEKLEVSEINLYDKKGYVLVRAHDISSFGQKEMKNFAVRRALRKGRAGFIVQKSTTVMKPTLLYVTPIRFQKEIIGAVSLGYYLDYKFANRLRKSSGSHVFLTYAEGVVASSFGRIKNLNAKFEAFPWLHMSLQKVDGGSENLFLDTRTRELNFKDEKGSDAAVVLATAVDNFWTQISILITLIFAGLLAGGATIFSLATAGKVASLVNTAIVDLQQGIGELSRGDLTFKIAEHAQDEFGQLARSFNKMSQQLNDSYEDLRTLNNIGQELAGVMRDAILLEVVTERAVRLLGLTLGAAFYPEDDNSFRLIASSPKRSERKAAYNSLVAISDEDTSPGRLLLDETILEFGAIMRYSIEGTGGRNPTLVFCREEPFAAHEIEVMRTLARQVEIALANIKKLQMESDIKTAALVQEALIPQEMPRVRGLEVHGSMNPAKGIGGDYFDFIVTNEDDAGEATELLMVLGDVSGKGVPAGLIMVMVRTMLHALAPVYQSMKKLILHLNDFIFENSSSSTFMTGVFSKWDAKAGRLRICGAGHETILIYLKEKDKIVEFDAGGTILGIASTANPEMFDGDIKEIFREFRIDLKPGDFVLIFTDGIPEARNTSKEELGNEAVREVVMRLRGRPIDEIVNGLVEATAEHMRGAAQHDDITLIGYRRT